MKHNQFITEREAPAQEKYPNRFKPGKSGNPGGRPKKTTAELKAVQKMKKLTPHAVEVVVGILDNEKASFYARLQAAQIIFDRAMGRPDTFLKVDSSEQSVQASTARLQSLFGSAENEAAVPVEDEDFDDDEDTDDDENDDENDEEEVTSDAG